MSSIHDPKPWNFQMLPHQLWNNTWTLKKWLNGPNAVNFGDNFRGRVISGGCKGPFSFNYYTVIHYCMQKVGQHLHHPPGTYPMWQFFILKNNMPYLKSSDVNTALATLIINFLSASPSFKLWYLMQLILPQPHLSNIPKYIYLVKSL